MAEYHSRLDDGPGRICMCNCSYPGVHVGRTQGWPAWCMRYHGIGQIGRANTILQRACKYGYRTPSESKILWANICSKYRHIASFSRAKESADRFKFGSWLGKYNIGFCFPDKDTEKRLTTLANVAEEILSRKGMTMKNTGDLRKALAQCFEQAANGTLSGDALRGVIGCANQINTSLAVEIKARAQLSREGVAVGAFGELQLSPEEKGEKKKAA